MVTSPKYPLALADEQNPSNKLSSNDILITKVHTLPPLKRHVIDVGYADTTSLIQLFQVRIDKFDDIERRGELYGNIEVIDCEGSYTLYHRDRDNSEHIRANDAISLTGPHCSIVESHGFAVNIELFLRDRSVASDSSQDFVLSKWQFSWDVFKPQVSRIARGKFLRDFCDRPDVLSSEIDWKELPAGYDQPLSATFESPKGCCLTMYYAILENACQAWIKVEVVDVKSVPFVVEYYARGSIAATYDHFEHGNDSFIVNYCKTQLLKTSDLKSVKVERWKEIQLSRWIVAVPAYTSLVIEADFWDISSNLKFGKGIVKFVPSHAGSAVDYIRGDGDFALRVMVSWNFGSITPDSFPY